MLYILMSAFGSGGRGLYLQPAKEEELARRQAGLTQVQVAKRLGRPHSYVSKCELGERRVDVIELRQLAKLYRKSMSFFWS